MALTVRDVVLSLVALLLTRWVATRMRRRKLPPGPTGLPIIGNLLDMPAGPSWKTYLQWSKKYGELKYK